MKRLVKLIRFFLIYHGDMSFKQMWLLAGFIGAGGKGSRNLDHSDLYYPDDLNPLERDNV